MPSSTTATVVLSQSAKMSMILTFLSLFAVLSVFHSVEIAITTLYPWKVREFAEEEGPNSPFATLDADITRVLTTILVTSTTCSIYATTIFSKIVASQFPTYQKYSAVVLTLLTLFFVELLPKSVGVSNAELVARKCVAPLMLLAKVVSPVGMCLNYLAAKTLSLFGLTSKSISDVSEEELRLIVSGASNSGSIESTEGDMIKGVLDLQDQRVKELMMPRVEIVAVPMDMSVANVLGVIRESGYSRIPVYDGEIDNIVGIILAKDLIDYFVGGMTFESVRLDKIKERESAISSDDQPPEIAVETAAAASTVPSANVPLVATFGFKGGVGIANTETVVKALTGAEVADRMSKSIGEAKLIEDMYFVAESMMAWNVLQEMKKRRVHLAIVVDEYGGTEGLVTLEDIIEEVVGEIYDEDDDEDMETFDDSIVPGETEDCYSIRGDADLDDVLEVLEMTGVDEEVLKEYGTLSGFLVHHAGEIPQPDDVLMIDKWRFEVLKADSRRILEVGVEKLIGGKESEIDFDTEDQDRNPKVTTNRMSASYVEKGAAEDTLMCQYITGDEIVDQNGDRLPEK